MSFIAELKQRKVIRVAIAYLVVAWVAIQAASIALPAFDAPDWTLRVVILLFALGFPLALLLTWALELTPEGHRRFRSIEPAATSRYRDFLRALAPREVAQLRRLLEKRCTHRGSASEAISERPTPPCRTRS